MNFSTFTSLALAGVLALSALPARANPTSLASVPLMSISGSGTVKPNLMLMYDDSGSMAFTHTPDYVDDATTCRADSTLARGTRACAIGDPPYAAPLFNKQYYNPAVRYRPPVRANRESYPSMTAANTGNWTAVTSDGFGIDTKNLRNVAQDSINLVTGFPDLDWCDANGDCRRNILGYTYPNGQHQGRREITGSPYYYTINNAEYCTNKNLETCVNTAVNAPAPSTTHTVAAPVRFCNSAALTKCQAKYVGDYIYPRFGDPNLASNWYSTITINNSGNTNSMSIASVSAVGVSGSRVITKDAVTASSGTDTPAKRQAVATALATSIYNSTDFTRPFTACLRAASGSVKACSFYGITLASNEMLAVIPINCGAIRVKANCTVIKEGERVGDEIVVTAGTVATAVLFVTGRANDDNSKRTVLRTLRWDTTTLISSLTLAKNATAAQVATAIAAAVNNRNITAYVGGNNVTAVCRNAPVTAVCFVGGAGLIGANLSIASVDNLGTLGLASNPGFGNGIPTYVSGFDTGIFIRTDIVSTRTSYPKAVGRTDCQAASNCSYDEEMTNFANWYAYYKSRNQMMKTAVGLSFEPLDDGYNVGLVGLQAGAAEGTMTLPKVFTGDNRSAWYSALYAMNSAGGTPVRQALHAIGKMFANQEPYKAAPGAEVVRFPCQQNFAFVTTDGYWNGNSPSELLEEATKNKPAVWHEYVTNNDNVVNTGRFCTSGSGCFDNRPQAKPSLADIALFWYNGGSSTGTVSLRPEIDSMATTGSVPGANTHLHMRTYALGLGVDGIMNYEPNYAEDPDEDGDFYKLTHRFQTGCPWNGGGPYVWPDPETGTIDLSTAKQSRVDDLWHAAINGGGKYFSASDPLQVIDAMNKVLNEIETATGAASAAATSTPNITQNDQDIFSSTFSTVKWTGNLSKRVINETTGIVSTKPEWMTAWHLGKKVAAATDTRKIWFRNPLSGAYTNFTYDLLGADQAWFKDKCGELPQCPRMTPEQRTTVNDGASIVNWLRGQQQHADNVLLRGRTRTEKDDIEPEGTAQLEVLGDIASSKPAYLREPRKGYGVASYTTFRAERATRKPTVFVAANDGMLHAFDGGEGTELWAYVPRITMGKLYRQASVNYGTAHQFSTDGSPELADVQIGGEWRSVLVAGLNAGGRGFYALDVTDPADPKPLWEICADSAICSGKYHQPEMGFSFGNPQFGTIKVDGQDRWVVFLTSGYNNIPGAGGIQTGSGKGHLFVIDVATGEAIVNLGAEGTMNANGVLTTGSGDTETPSGLAKITAITANPNTDPLITFVYGGDNLGQMWRFDFTGDKVERILMANAGSDQPITTRPDVAMCQVNTLRDEDDEEEEEGDEEVDTSPTRRVVTFGTGRLLDLSDIENDKRQSTYVLKDDGKAFDADTWRNNETYAKRQLTETIPYNPANPNVARSNIFQVSGTEANMSRHRGWFVDFDKNTGERVNLDPKIVSGTLTVVTNLPQTSTSCNVGGVSYAYFFDVCTGRAVSNDIAGALLSGDAAAVGTTIVRLPSGALKLITTTAKGSTITTDVKPAQSQDARRTGWRRVRD